MSGTRLCPEGSGEPLEGSTYGRVMRSPWQERGSWTSPGENVLGAVGVQSTAPVSVKHGRYRGAVWGEAVSSGWGSSLGDGVIGT